MEKFGLLGLLLEKNRLGRSGYLLMFIYLLAVLGVVLYGLGRMDRQLRQEVAASLVTLNGSVRASLERWHQTMQRELRHLAADPALRQALQRLEAEEGRGQQTHRLIQDLCRTHLQVAGAEALYLYPSDSQMPMAQACSEGVPAPPQLTQPQVQRALAGETLLTHADTRPLLLLANPVLDASGRPLAMLLALFDVEDSLHPLVENVRLGQSGETYLVGGQGHLLTQSRFMQELAGLSHFARHGRQLQGLRAADPGGNLLRGHSPQGPPRQWPLTQMAKALSLGQSGMDAQGYRDYRGVMVIGAWSWSGPLAWGWPRRST